MKKNKIINRNNLKVGDIIDLEIYSEICCDMCNDIIHNHLNCPICEDEYADSDQFCSMYDDEKEIQCECGTVYQLVSGSWYNDAKVKIVSIG